MLADGENVVDELDEERCDPALLEEFLTNERERWADEASEARLRRMEGGW